MMQPILVTEKSSLRVFPTKRHLLESKQFDLSLLDATVANFSNTGALWILRPSALTEADLLTSLALTLDYYAPWCGRIEQIPSVPEKANSSRKRYGRLRLVYSDPDDPGVDVSSAESTTSSKDILHNSDIKHTGYLGRSASLFEPLFPNAKLQDPIKGTEGSNNSVLAIRLTTLHDGAIAIGIRMHHSLADAHGLIYFVKDWASITRAQKQTLELPSLNPLFDPDLLTKLARDIGDINTSIPDPSLIKAAHDLPLERNDWWATSIDVAEPPSSFGNDAEANIPVGRVMPWVEWDVKAPVARYVVHFTKFQTDKIFASATAKSAAPVSRHDAVLAHIWTCINRARNLENSQSLVHFNHSIGLRNRLRLGDNFMGSPMIMADTRLPGSTACSTSLDLVATSLRNAITDLSADKLKLHMYGVEFEKSPQRIWSGFLGKYHVICTSWCRTGVYNINFGSGAEVEMVEALMPQLDGILQIMEARPNRDERNSDSDDRDTSEAWYDHGIDAAVNLDRAAMERFIKDPLLFP